MPTECLSRWPMARFDSFPLRLIQRSWLPRLQSTAENRSTWVTEYLSENENPDLDSSLARGIVDSARAGHDFGKLSGLLSTQLRFALPARSRSDVFRRLL